MIEHRHITRADALVSLGSCFSEEIGRLLEKAGYDILVNPFGVLYNPASISSAVRRLSSTSFFGPEDVIERDPNYGRRKKGKPLIPPGNSGHRPIAPCLKGYVSFFHHGSFTRETPEAFLLHANQALKEARAHFSRSRWILVTLGTAWVYRHIERDLIVSNCHKHPASEFQRIFLSLEEVSVLLEEMIRAVPPTADGQPREWIFSVSPIRYLKDGLHNNQLSKATLLLAIDAICRKYPNVHYFPAYETVLDELRDYSHFAEDTVHPNEETVRYVYERFKTMLVR